LRSVPHEYASRYFPRQRLLLSIKAELENVTGLVPASDDFEYFFQVSQTLNVPKMTKMICLYKVKCTSCHETHPNLVALNRVVGRETAIPVCSCLTFECVARSNVKLVQARAILPTLCGDVASASVKALPSLMQPVLRYPTRRTTMVNLHRSLPLIVEV
jgi:hypothetical protein